MRIAAADLFCGAGGTSSGLVEACQALGMGVDLVAVNHWQVAIETHSANLPGARHICARIEAVNPREVVPGGYLRLLCASPECTHHSVARGGRPVNDQARAGAWEIVRWASELFVENILVENVPEFRTWGPVGRRGRPLKRWRGKTFDAWVAALRSLGYSVEARVLCAADYGDPTTRRRLFVQATRGRAPIAWPEPTHNAGGTGGLARWRAAREVIDWGTRGRSIFDRARPLAPATLRRIEAGLRRFGGDAAGPWIEALRTGRRQPCGEAGVEAFLMCNRFPGSPEHDNRYCRPPGVPAPTVTGAGNSQALVEPFLVGLRGTSPTQIAGSARGMGEPVSTLTTSGTHMALCQPMVIGQQSGAVARGVDMPLPTVACAGAVSLVEPFLVRFHGSRPGTTDADRRTAPLDRPVSTLDTSNRLGLCEPFLVAYYGTGGAHGLGDPAPTLTAKARLGLVEPMMADILFRMLQPGELAGAQGFPAGYRFAGTKTDVVRQIGNAVPHRTARALCEAILRRAV